MCEFNYYIQIFLFVCSQTSGVAPTVAFIRKQPRDYRLSTVLASIFCFFPIGLIAVYFSYQVRFCCILYCTRLIHQSKFLPVCDLFIPKGI